MTQKLLEALKPCPFCGAEGETIDTHAWLGHDDHGPGCMGCGCTALSVEKWNRRTLQQTGWISAKERQPDRVDYYQILTKNEATAHGIKRRFPYNAYWNGESWWGGIMAPIELSDVEYWTEIMPLPKPPEAG